MSVGETKAKIASGKKRWHASADTLTLGHDITHNQGLENTKLSFKVIFFIYHSS